MNRQTWHDLSTFAAIADAGSFTGAAKPLGISPSALSHAMRAMEERLGLRLLNRSTRSVAPTEAGERLLAQLRPAIVQLDATVRQLEADCDKPAGRIRISAHRTAANLVIAPRLPAFALAYPDIQVELSVEDGLVDVVATGFDAGVRHEQVLEQDMISVRVSEPMRTCYVASPAYWARMGRPKVAKDLLAHRGIGYRMTSSGGVMRWRFERRGATFMLDPTATLISNDIDVIKAACISDMGVACLLESQVSRELADGTLIAVLKEWSPTIAPNYLYYPSRRQLSAAMRVFVNAMRLG
ncbi:LysR family transcriptional regulator [Lichenicoccus sp.]|uniref:LysR family transcriptional regulator n=1 Tax=Lichenicoccus sp. TaxID=2781899 RepID=UPI003D13B9AB